MIRFGVLSLLLAAGAANAQTNEICMWSDELDAGLIDWYGERPVESSSDGSIVLWANDEAGTWTLVVYRASGEACTLDSGTTSLSDSDAVELMASFNAPAQG